MALYIISETGSNFSPKRSGIGMLRRRTAAIRPARSVRAVLIKILVAKAVFFAHPISRGNGFGKLAGQGRTDTDVKHIDQAPSHGNRRIDPKEIKARDSDRDWNRNKPENDRSRFREQRCHDRQFDGTVTMFSVDFGGGVLTRLFPEKCKIA